MKSQCSDFASGSTLFTGVSYRDSKIHGILIEIFFYVTRETYFVILGRADPCVVLWITPEEIYD